MMNLYQEEILEHYRNPRHKGRLLNPTVSEFAKNLSCGDTLGVDLVVKDGIIQDIGFWGDGCAISQAAMSMLSEQLVGQRVSVLGEWDENGIISLLRVPIGPNRKKCGLLSLDVIQKLYEKSQKSEN